MRLLPRHYQKEKGAQKQQRVYLILTRSIAFFGIDYHYLFYLNPLPYKGLFLVSGAAVHGDSNIQAKFMKRHYFGLLVIQPGF